MAGRFTHKHLCASVLRFGSRAALSSALLMAFAGSVHNATATGDTRSLTLHHTHSGEDLTVTFKRNGRYDEDGLRKLNHFLRDWRSQDETKMNPQLFDIVWEVYRDVGAKDPVQIISAYRAPKTNSMLRRRSSGVARNSLHMQGMAMDFFIPGVSLEQIRFAGLRLQRGGVGFYPTSGSPFVHLDVGNVRAWPRLSREQLVRLFPDGRTVHIPSDGQPLSGYALAQADIEKRPRGGSAPSSKNFLASLFGKSDDDEDEAPAAAVPTRVASAAPVAARSETRSDAIVPLPRVRPAIYQVASAAPSRVVEAPKPAAPQTPADIINSRGFWDETPADNNVRQALAAAATGRQSTASISQQALAYAPPRTERPQVVAASAPLPAFAAVPGREPRAQTVGLASFAQAAPHLNAAATRTTETLAGRKPWTLAMMITPSVRSHLTTSAISAFDMTSLRGLLQKPRHGVVTSFTPDLRDAMPADRFSGPSLTALRTVNYAPQAIAAVR